MKSKNDAIKISIFFVCVHIIGLFTIWDSINDWQLQQMLMKQGIQTEAIVEACAFSRTGSCRLEYEYEVSIDNEQLNYYRKTYTSCVYCEGKPKIKVRYLPENPQIVAIEGEMPTTYIFGLFFIFTSWLMVLGYFMPDKWREWRNRLKESITNRWQNTKD